MNIKWLGHSCFLLTSEAGTRILMDPCDPSVGYCIKPMEVDAVTCSHNHYDHNYVAVAQGSQVQYITGAGAFQVKEVALRGFPCWHDDQQGALRGQNIMYLVEMDGLRLLHCGDLGHMPSEETIQAIGPIDILLIPIGGTYTLDHSQALAVCERLHPAVVVPMHYQTESLNMNLEGLMPFLNGAPKEWRVHRMRQSEATLTPESLGKDRIIVLDHACKAAG